MMVTEERMMRDTYVDLLIEYAKLDPRIVLVEADLMKAAGTLRFQEEFPDRAVDVGVQEASMIGVAAGMAAMGKIPFTHSFTAFASRRVCDQVTLSVAYADLNVKMMGSDPGITAELNGGTHMSMEDVAIMRNIPGMMIVEPVDSAQLRELFPQILNHPGAVYIRLMRKNAVKIYDDAKGQTLGKGVLLRPGKDVTIVATGILVAQAMEAAKELAAAGIDAELIHMHTIKPLDTELLLQSVGKTGAVVTAENHSIINGLGSAVAECISENCPVPLRRIGVRDHFGEVGSTAYLMEKYGMTHDKIVQAAMAAVAMKR